MGVCQQVEDGVTGVLVDPSQDDELVDWRFASEAVALLHNHSRRRTLAEGAARSARLRARPDRCVQRYYEAMDLAKRHCRETARERATRRPGRYLARWTALHAAVAGFGLMRPPAVVNRHGRRQPGWDAFADTSERTSSPSIVVPRRPVSTDPGRPRPRRPGEGEAIGA